MKTANGRPMRWAALFCFPALAWAQTFTFEIASPVAAQDFATKSAAFVFRTAGCTESPQVSASAEGVVEGSRRTLPLKVTQSTKPGVYSVFQQWTGGHWIVVLKGSCGSAQAGAIVPIGPRGFVRADSKFLSHPATAAEVEAALKAYPEGGYK